MKLRSNRRCNQESESADDMEGQLNNVQMDLSNVTFTFPLGVGVKTDASVEVPQSSGQAINTPDETEIIPPHPVDAVVTIRNTREEKTPERSSSPISFAGPSQINNSPASSVETTERQGNDQDKFQTLLAFMQRMEANISTQQAELTASIAEQQQKIDENISGQIKNISEWCKGNEERISELVQSVDMIKGCMEKIPILEQRVQQLEAEIEQRIEIASQNLLAQVKETAEVKALLVYQEQQEETNRRLFAELEKRAVTLTLGSPAPHHATQFFAPLRPTNFDLEGIQEREGSTDSLPSSETQTRQARNSQSTCDTEFDVKHFISVQNLQKFKDSGNTLHPKVWLAQFDVPLPKDWPLQYKLSFICGFLEGNTAQEMRNRAISCTSYEMFKQAFLELHWGRNKQLRVRKEMSTCKAYERSGCNSPVQFFEQLLRKNQFLDSPFPQDEIINICYDKLPRAMHQALIGQCGKGVEAFKDTLREVERVFENDGQRERPQAVYNGHQNQSSRQYQPFSRRNNGYLPWNQNRESYGNRDYQDRIQINQPYQRNGNGNYGNRPNRTNVNAGRENNGRNFWQPRNHQGQRQNNYQRTWRSRPGATLLNPWEDEQPNNVEIRPPNPRPQDREAGPSSQ